MEAQDIELSSAQMAVVLGVTERRVRQLAADGIVRKAQKRGRYRLVPSVAGYCASLEKGQDVGLDEIRRERLLRLQMERAQQERTLITMEEAGAVVDRLTGEFVAMLNGLPARITNDIRERRRQEAIIDQVRQSLTDKFSELTQELEGAPK